MKIISHRGNINGPSTASENSPNQIEEALINGFDCEVDVWYINGFFLLGHDAPKYRINVSFLQNEKLWCHAKNLESLSLMIKDPLIHCFWHQEDDFTLTSKKYIWTFPQNRASENSVIVDNSIDWKMKNYTCFGVCTDYCL